MQTLEKLLSKYASETDARWWVGQRPAACDEQFARAIATQVGLPTSIDDPFARDGMTLLDWADAARVLAVAGTTSLAYDAPVPSDEAVMEAKAALKDLKYDATFFTNGRWEAGSQSWNPLTTATFDCGVIGFDRENAFIFWIEEAD